MSKIAKDSQINNIAPNTLLFLTRIQMLLVVNYLLINNITTNSFLPLTTRMLHVVAYKNAFLQPRVGSCQFIS